MIGARRHARHDASGGLARVLTWWRFPSIMRLDARQKSPELRRSPQKLPEVLTRSSRNVRDGDGYGSTFQRARVWDARASASEFGTACRPAGWCDIDARRLHRRPRQYGVGEQGGARSHAHPAAPNSDHWRVRQRHCIAHGSGRADRHAGAIRQAHANSHSGSHRHAATYPHTHAYSHSDAN
jgi:hypothetical protein